MFTTAHRPTKEAAAANLNHILAHEARLNRLHRLFKTQFNVTEPSLVMEPYLFLGNCISAHDVNRLSRLGVRYVLNVAIRDVEVCPYYARDIRTLSIDLRDDDRENILRSFDQAFAFIDEARRAKSRVLVHCSHGQSRSPAIVIAYLMRTYHVSLEQCLMHVVKARPCVIPNDGFLKQLILYDRFLVDRRRKQQQEQDEATLIQAGCSSSPKEIPIQHKPAASQSPVEPPAPVILSPPECPSISETSSTHISSVDSTSLEQSSSSSIQSSTSSNSVHVIPIQVSRPDKTEPISGKQRSMEDIPILAESLTIMKLLQEKSMARTSATAPVKAATVASPSKETPPSSRRFHDEGPPHEKNSPTQMSRPDIDKLVNSSHKHYDQPSFNLSSPQWNFLNHYPSNYHTSTEHAQVKYITEIYDRATNRFIPTTCCY